MKIRNISPLGDLEVPALRMVVAAGAVIEAPDELGASLLEQSETWAAVSAKTKTADTAEKE